MFKAQGFAALLLAGIVVAHPTVSTAQYFESSTAIHQVVKASGHDSVLVERTTPFELPATNDTIKFMYHEPMPDSIMPRSAIVLGTITLQFEDPDDIVAALEKYARKAGADWIVSFQEPKAVLTTDRWKVYRSTATLLHVLDPQFINQTDIAYSYFEKNNLSNYAAVNQWFDQFGRHMGARLDAPEPPSSSEQDEHNPDK